MPFWMRLVYIWVLKKNGKLEDLLVSCNPTTKKILIAPKETTPLTYKVFSDMKQYILGLREEKKRG